MKHQVRKPFIMGGIFIVLLASGGAVVLAHINRTTNTVVEASVEQLLGPIRTNDDGTHTLCSPYANMCFDYPADWTRATILNGSNFYGETLPGGIELNPPTGTIITLAKNGPATATICKDGATCTLTLSRIAVIADDSYVLAGNFRSVSASGGSDRSSPFVVVVSGSALRNSKVDPKSIVPGKAITVPAFYPDLQTFNGGSVELLASPGNAYTVAAALKWLDGTEAQSVFAAFNTIREYKST